MTAGVVQEEVDRFCLAYLIYVLLGAGTLYPWNAFISAADYFEVIYPGRHSDRLFTVAYLPGRSLPAASSVLCLTTSPGVPG